MITVCFPLACSKCLIVQPVADSSTVHTFFFTPLSSFHRNDIEHCVQICCNVLVVLSPPAVSCSPRSRSPGQNRCKSPPYCFPCCQTDLSCFWRFCSVPVWCQLWSLLHYTARSSWAGPCHVPWLPCDQTSTQTLGPHGSSANWDMS